MNDAALPILYSFRRCPYAIRARLALRYAGISVELREVSLRAKPAQMIESSPKGTVPVLVLPGNREAPKILEESMDIIHWSLASNDPDAWLTPDTDDAELLINSNDADFKYWLDRYKYPERYEIASADKPLAECHEFLARLERLLVEHEYLIGDRMTVADVAVFPFVRQFAFVDEDRFAASPFNAVQVWLDRFLRSELFASVMQKYPVWKPDSVQIVF